MLHALLVERRKYGPIGWVNPYEFLNEDFNVSFSYLRSVLSQNAHPNYSVLQLVIAKINYGGRIIDANDEKTIMTLIKY